MKTAIIYYSWSGHTRALAQERAAQDGSSVFEVRDRRRPGTLKAYTAGCFAAMRMKRTPIRPLDIEFAAYDAILLMAPVWAGALAPAANTVLAMLPPGKNVAVVAVSGSGSSRCREKVGELIRSRGCKFTGYEDIKG